MMSIPFQHNKMWMPVASSPLLSLYRKARSNSNPRLARHDVNTGKCRIVGSMFPSDSQFPRRWVTPSKCETVNALKFGKCLYLVCIFFRCGTKYTHRRDASSNGVANESRAYNIEGDHKGCPSPAESIRTWWSCAKNFRHSSEIEKIGFKEIQ